MVYSEGKLQSCLKLGNFQNRFNKDKSVPYHAQKRPKICTRVSEAKSYLYHSTKKARPGFNEIA